MGALDWLGSWAGSDELKAAQAAGAQIDQTLAPGSDYWKSGDLGLSTPGSQGNAYINQAAQIGANNISANYTPLDQDAAALNAISGQYYSQFLHGGKAEEAARNRATSSLGEASGGGLAGVANLRNVSQQLSGQAGQTALNERGAAAQNATQASFAAGMLALRKAAFQAAVTHANIQKNLGAQNVMNTLQNTQGQLNNQLTAGANNARGNQNAIAQGIKNSQTQFGLQTLSAGLQAGAAGAAIGIDQMGSSPVPGSTVSESEIQNEAANTYAKLGFEPSSLPAASATLTGQEAAQVNQDNLTAALQGSSAIKYPNVPPDASRFLTSPLSYPVNSKLGS